MSNSFRLIAIFIVVASGPAFATDWYVTGKGEDSQDGKLPESAFRTLKKAAQLVRPGDTVHVGNGVYTDTPSAQAVLPLTISGLPEAWITWEALPGTSPEIRPTGWHGILITASYQIIDGLHVVGNNDSTTLLEALSDGALREKNGKKYAGDPGLNTNGITIEGRKLPRDNKPHHIVIRNCEVAKCAGGGVTALEADYVTIEDCLVYDNCWFMRYGGSGITTLNNWAFDDAPGYHFVIQRNKVWNNKTLVPWVVTGKLSDGNGILLDVTDNAKSGAANPNADASTLVTQAKPLRPDWKGRSLIANNLSAFNGGSGIHTFRTAHVDIVNNTTYWNGGVVGYEEMFPNRSDDIVFLNNIVVPRPGGQVTSNNASTNIRWDYNLYPKAQNVLHGMHDIVTEVAFIKPQRDVLQADFKLAPNNPGVDSGTDELPQAMDVIGQPRPTGRGHDRGAFEQ